MTRRLRAFGITALLGLGACGSSSPSGPKPDPTQTPTPVNPAIALTARWEASAFERGRVVIVATSTANKVWVSLLDHADGGYTPGWWGPYPASILGEESAFTLMGPGPASGNATLYASTVELKTFDPAHLPVVDGKTVAKADFHYGPP